MRLPIVPKHCRKYLAKLHPAVVPTLCKLFLIITLFVHCLVLASPTKKAYFIYRMATFSYWETEKSTLAFCIVEGNEVAQALRKVVRGRTIDEYSIRVEQISQGFDLSTCNLVYFAGESGKSARDVLNASASSNILTIGESDDFLANGGAILLQENGDKLRFQVHQTNLKRGGVRVGSRALALARKIYD